MKPTNDNPSASIPELTRHWYAIYVRPSHEIKVARSFDLREIESYLPQYRVERRWKNRCTKKLDLPLFPGYLFAHICPKERVTVLQVPSVVSIVSTAGGPLPLADGEVEILRSGLPARNAAPHPYLKQGERGRIRRGALAGMEGVIIRGKNNARVVISLDLIMKSVAVEVDWEDLEPCAPLAGGSPNSLPIANIGSVVLGGHPDV